MVIAGLILLVLGVNYLKGFNPFSPSNTYYAHYEKIDGLAVSNPVLVNGFKVGQVTEVKFTDEGDGSLLVGFDIEESALLLTKDATAKIISSDLFGTKAINLIAGTGNEAAQPGKQGEDHAAAHSGTQMVDHEAARPHKQGGMSLQPSDGP